MTTTPRSALSAPRNAEEIKKAFRRKARELHPDVNKAPGCRGALQGGQRSLRCALGPPKREQYDTYGSVGRGPGGAGGGGYQYVDLNDLFGGGASGGFDMGDLFSAFFGGVTGAQRGAGSRAATWPWR